VAFRVAILGNSAMWGQGLLREHSFAHLAASRIAADRSETLELVEGPGVEPLRGTARSGAKIKARTDEGEVDVLLPSGATTRQTAGDRATFAMTFRSLFDSDRDLRSFLAGEAETPAAQLFGENPATFPTVTDQIREMEVRAAGDLVQLVLLDGGVNDAEFEEVLDPQGPDISKINREIELIFGKDLPEAIARTRRAFPRAVIVVTGYYSALSQESDRDELEELFEYMSEKPEWQIALNEFNQQIPVWRDVLNLIGFGVDVEGLIEKAIRRSITAAAHAHFWARRGIGSLSGTVRGPGVVFAYPAFRPQHALFAGGPSLVYDDYRPPGDDEHVVSDEMLAARLRRIPRRGLRGTYRTASKETVAALSRAGLTERQTGEPTLPEASRSLIRALEELVAREDLPSQILIPARSVLRGVRAKSTFRDLATGLDSEIGRIEIATIASFIHPNPAGARRYADRIVTAYRRGLRFSVREAVRGMAVAGADRVRLSSLGRHGVDPGRGLRQLAPIAFIDSVAVQLRGLVTGPRIPGAFAFPTTMSLGPRVSFEVLIPFGVTTLFRAFDARDDLKLVDITEVTLGRAPTFEELELFLNGHTFFRGRRDDAQITGDTVRFSIRR
jgi:hypothetical protein